MKFICFMVGMLALLVESRAYSATCPAPDRIVRVAVPGHPFSALADADGCWLFVSATDDKEKGSVVVLHNSGGSFEVDHTLALKTAANGAALSHDGKLLIVAGGRSAVVLDVARLERGDDHALLEVLPGEAGDGAVYAAISPDDKLLFVADEYASRISVFDLAKARVTGFRDEELIGHIPVAAFPVGLSFSPDGQWLYATSQRGPESMKSICKPEQRGGQMHPPGLLFKIDVAKAATDAAHATAMAWRVGCNPVRVAISPSGTLVWVTARADNALMKIHIDGDGHASIGAFPVGKSPVGVVVRPDGKQVWVALSDRFDKNGAGELAALTHFEGPQIKLMTVPSSGFPRELSFLPDGRTLVATLFAAGLVELVPTPD